MVTGERIVVDLEHIEQRLLQLFERMLANAGVRLVEGQAGSAQQVSQIAFRHRREALSAGPARRLR